MEKTAGECRNNVKSLLIVCNHKIANIGCMICQWLQFFSLLLLLSKIISHVKFIFGMVIVCH